MFIPQGGAHGRRRPSIRVLLRLSRTAHCGRLGSGRRRRADERRRVSGRRRLSGIRRAIRRARLRGQGRRLRQRRNRLSVGRGGRRRAYRGRRIRRLNRRRSGRRLRGLRPASRRGRALRQAVRCDPRVGAGRVCGSGQGESRSHERNEGGDQYLRRHSHSLSACGSRLSSPWNARPSDPNRPEASLQKSGTSKAAPSHA